MELQKEIQPIINDATRRRTVYADLSPKSAKSC